MNGELRKIMVLESSAIIKEIINSPFTDIFIPYASNFKKQKCARNVQTGMVLFCLISNMEKIMAQWSPSVF
jgi:hypothetical protein